MHRCAPVRFVRSTASQSSSFIRRASVSRVIAALFTRISSRPNFASTCWNPAFTCAESATSIGTARAAPPTPSISATSEASFSLLRAAAPTIAPAPASASAVARPIPCDAPVTSATLCLSENIRLVFRRFRACLCNLVERCLQTRGVLHVQGAHGPVNLPQQPGEHFARSYLHKYGHTALDHLVDRIEPAHWLGYLPDQRVARLVTARDRFRV